MESSNHSSPPGSALIIVLGFLALITAIVIAFLSSVTTQLTTSKTVANSASVHQLADSAVNVVMAQIVDATKGQASGKTLAWASQPGMIRTYDAAAKPHGFYKLYSSDKMTISGTGFTSTLDLPPPDWNSAANIELYTDINAPALDARRLLVYPIVDPSADGTTNPKLPSEPPMKVEGFSITSSPGFEATMPESQVNNRAPMPVRWLYVLRDGSLRSPTAGSGTITVPGATKINPIVGRIAFWTDDESCKVNINTASEGVYWDVPRFYSAEDFGQYSGSSVSLAGFSNCQPTQNEFQRYPGHPATTCLSPVFGKLLPVPYPYPANPTAADSTKLDAYYRLTPRVGLQASAGGGGGGSKSGSFQVPNGDAPMVTDTDRLYSSVDELMFTPRLQGTSRVVNTSPIGSPTTTPAALTKEVLEKAKFFITAHSTAPETTLYNTPRIAVWPVNANAALRTTYDSLLAFCSTIGGKEYSFTRSDSRSGTADFNTRNSQLYSYLQKLTSMDVPGFGGNFLAKYPADAVNGSGAIERDQILTYLFDYVRCTNLQDKSNGSTPYTKVFAEGKPRGSGEVVPIRIGATQGFGRFHGITSANLLFYGTRLDAGNKTDQMSAVFFIAIATPQQGLACIRSGLKYTVKGLEDLKAGGKSLNFKVGGSTNGTNFIDMTDLDQFHGRGVGGAESPWTTMMGKPFNYADAGGSVSGKYPFFSSSEVDVSGSTFAFSGTPADKEIIVEVRTADTDYLIQTVRLKFPAGEFKTPGVGTPPTGTSPTKSGYGSRTGGHYGSMIHGTDTVVSLQTAGAKGNSEGPELDPTSGDSRMVLSLIDVPAKRYRPHKDYTTSGVQWAHSLVQTTGSYFPGAKYGKLANVPTYKQVNIERQPDISSRAPDGVTHVNGGPGDWDTGFGDQKDGAHINKPDEGDTNLLDDVGGGKRLPYMLGYGRGFASATNVYFSPNRQIPSPLMFGSIPTGVARMRPWQTLLLHSRPEDPSHPGNSVVKDHLLMDLFWMPVVQPYAISQPFATSGKLNMNYQIVPFTYINRSTGMHAVMKSTRFAALDASDSNKYKPLDHSNKTPTVPNRRQSIDIPKTLEAFDTKFGNNEIFKSATQICEMNLVPPGETNANMANFWKTKFTFTGDNLREKPYVDIYPRLTTKSNTYTVHVRVQTLKKVPGTPPDQWVSGRDQVLGEYRGSSLLERYIDLNDPTLPDFAAKFASNPADDSLNIDRYYRMRVVSKKRFAP